MTNELVNTETGEITTQTNNFEEIVQDTNEYTIVKTAEGKFRKDMKYRKFFSKVPETNEDLIELYNLLNSQDESLVTPMKKVTSEIIEIHQIYTNPYTSFDEDTGRNTNGVTTLIYDGERHIATSSKSVYYRVLGLFEVFGYPNSENYKPIKVQVTETKMQNGYQIDLKLISLS